MTVPYQFKDQVEHQFIDHIVVINVILSKKKIIQIVHGSIPPKGGEFCYIYVTAVN